MNNLCSKEFCENCHPELYSGYLAVAYIEKAEIHSV